MLQLYRLYVVQAETRKAHKQKRKMAHQSKHRRPRTMDWDGDEIYTITKGRSENSRRKKR